MNKIILIMAIFSLSITAYSLECDFDYTGEYQLKILPKLSGHQEYVECSNFDLDTEKGKKDLYAVLIKSFPEYEYEDGSSYIENEIGARCWKNSFKDKIPAVCSLGDEYFR